MNEHGITKENLMGALPPALRGDPSVVALAEALATVLADRLPEIDRLLIYPAIETLDEPLLDILAYDFKVDWWDPEYTLEEKRRTVKDSWRVHKTLGTKYAVETAIRAIYPKADAEAWFQYGGEPYHFRLRIDLSHEQWSEGKPKNVLDRVRFYQSLRDHMDSVQYTIVFPPAVLYAGGLPDAQISLGLPQGRDKYEHNAALYTGGAGGIQGMTGVREDAAQSKGAGTLRVGVTSAAFSSLSVPAGPTLPSSTTILRTGGMCTIISNSSKGE